MLDSKLALALLILCSFCIINTFSIYQSDISQRIKQIIRQNTKIHVEESELNAVDDFLDHVIKVYTKNRTLGYNATFDSPICKACQWAFLSMLSVNTTEIFQLLSEFGTEVCYLAKIEDDLTVCEGAVWEMVPIIFSSAGKHFLNPNYTCPLIDACPQVYFPEDLGTYISTILADKPNKTYPTPTGRATYKMVHLTDLHFDMEYEEGTNANCIDPLCCRNSSGQPNSTSDAAGYWGKVGNCDIPVRTVDQFGIWTLANINPDLMIWTGDNIAHDIWEQSKAKNINYTVVSTNILKQYFNISIYPMIGNHECYPVNEYDYAGTREQDLTTAFADIWEDWIGTEAANFYSQYGYFTSFNEEYQVRIIAINTQACNDLNWFLFQNPTDPGGMLAWMREVLYQAEANDEAVFIIGHIPPSDTGCLYQWTARYKALTDRFSYNIRGQFFGHSHKDYIHLTKSYINNETVGIIYETPSLTTYSQYSPAVRVFEIDLDTNIPVNIYQYRLNLDYWNSNHTGPISWDLCYDFLSEYGLQNMSFASFDYFVELILTDEEINQKYGINTAGCYGDHKITNGIDYGLYCSTNSVGNDAMICEGQTNFTNFGDIETWFTVKLEGPWVTTNNSNSTN